MRALDISGERFSRLLATSREGGKWRCLCDCGGEKLVAAGYLTRGLVKSCGCLLKEKAAQRCRDRANPELAALRASGLCRCATCHAIKPIREFSGGHSPCKPCASVKAAMWRADNPELYREQLLKVYPSQRAESRRSRRAANLCEVQAKERARSKRRWENPTEDMKAKARGAANKAALVLSDSYVKSRLQAGVALSPGQSIPGSLIELKREQLRLHRLANEMKQAINQRKETENEP